MSFQMQKADWETNLTSHDNITRKEWSGTQTQRITNKQFPPHKYKFPYWVITKKEKGYIQPHNLKFTNRVRTVDDSGGKWYFEDELIFATKAMRKNYNVFQGGWYNGLILMTKYEAREMGLSESEILKNYRQDELFDKQAKRYGTKATFFFDYRIDGSIESIYTPPPPPPPLIKYIEVPVPPPDKPVIEPAPEPVFEVSKPEPVEEERVVTVAKTDNMKWILLAIVGVGILVAIIFTLRGRQ